MQKLKMYGPKTVEKMISRRSGETKFGEEISFLENLADLQKSKSKFVIFGIPEDLGVRANHGKPGTADAWADFLQAFLNIQKTQYLEPSEVILLGEINTSEEMEKAGNLDVSDPNYFAKLGDLVEKIDSAVSEVVEVIISAGKTPIIIGGGHNNAYGNLKGVSRALKQPVNVINIDAHTDLRQLEHRHSGNGFSYAFKKGYLQKYSVYGLQQNYTPQYIYEQKQESDQIKFTFFEDLHPKDPKIPFLEDLEFAKKEPFGLDLDCDAIANFPSSAVSPSGFTVDQVRHFLKLAGNEKNCRYLHICEAMPSERFSTGKALSFFVTDFLKAKLNADHTV